ncbi:recombinase family protein [Streptomyces sp. CBMA29]|uniref:recombinase family protein n=1 Tax=Streptomyces sp. CBMA29 TaxID=1896314 RepID=UPI001661EA7E|nr:recombinase family protein [Streptomyces sp. CBMA29]MBD0736157.1 resolvase [Streptomyces sp. CBMA29]
MAVRRLSRKKDATSSPEKQEAQDLKAAASVGGHIIAWADDWEVSGATDPMTRPGLGPWLRGEMGQYSGIVGPSVDRIGRNQRCVLNTAHLIHRQKKLLVTDGHDGPWNLDDSADEVRLSIDSLGAQMEHRAMQKRNRDGAVTARSMGKPNNAPSYGFQYVRLVPMGRVDHVELHEGAAETARDVANRLLADETGKITPYTEAARLTRAGVLSPSDHMAVMYGREPEGIPWSAKSLIYVLTNEASLGYLTHQGRPVLDERTGQPVRLCEGLWDRPTRDRLVEKCKPVNPQAPTEPRAPKGTRLGSKLGTCGNCGHGVTVGSRGKDGASYRCTGRAKGVKGSEGCAPAPSIKLSMADELITEWFLSQYGSGEIVEKVWDPGSGHGSRIAELKADRARLRADRMAGLYDDEDDAEWYQAQYTRIGKELKDLRALPDRPAGMRMVPTGKTVAQAWAEAPDDAARRELLATYDVRFTLFPQGAKERLTITGMDMYAVALAA